MPIVQCTLRGIRSSPLELRVADQNRVRWATAALKSNFALANSLHHDSAQGQQAHLVDSISLVQAQRIPFAGSHIILWDGFNGYIELLQRLPEIETVNFLKFVIVGRIKDLESAFRTMPLALFAPEPLTSTLHTDPRCELELPYFARQWLRWRTRMRASKTALSDPQRHRQLSGARRIVFCGLVRPRAEVAISLMRGCHDDELAERMGMLCDTPLDRVIADDKIAGLFDAIRIKTSKKPVELAAAYALISVLHRVGVLSLLAHRKVPLFISEFGRDRHIDPYDATAYHQHLFLDFGSTRGPDIRYPRTVDLAATGKQALALRFMAEGECLVNYLADTSAARFLEQCADHSERAAAVAFPSRHPGIPAV